MLAPGVRITVKAQGGSIAGVIALYQDVVRVRQQAWNQRIGVISNYDTCLVIALVNDDEGLAWALLLTEEEPFFLGWTWQVERLEVI